MLLKLIASFSQKGSKNLGKIPKIPNIPKPQITQIIGEDRSFGGNELFIDLIPRSCWFKSIRESIVKPDWDRLREFVYKRANNKCQCCGSSQKLEGHERWMYDKENSVQILTRVLALCKRCHLSTHMGLAQMINQYKQSKEHMKKVRNWSQQEYQNHENEAFSLWRQRNKIQWTQNLQFITKNNLRLAQKKQTQKKPYKIREQHLEAREILNEQGEVIDWQLVQIKIK